MISATDFTRHLLPKEKVLWCGRPRQGVMLTASDTFKIPFSVLWGGFAIFWETSVLTNSVAHRSSHVGVVAPWFMALFGLPFVLVGLFLIVGRFFLDARIRAKTIYAVTDRRIFIERSGSWAKFTALALDRLPEASLVDLSGTRGSIQFGPATSIFSRGASSWGAWMASLDPAPKFLGIDDAERVFRLIQAQNMKSVR